jgi:hypothetical protein
VSKESEEMCLISYFRFSQLRKPNSGGLLHSYSDESDAFDDEWRVKRIDAATD